MTAKSDLEDLADLHNPTVKEEARTRFEQWHTARRPSFPEDEREYADLIAEAWIDGFLAGRRTQA